MLCIALATGAPARAQQPACAGDCDGDGRVVIAELIRAVNVALASLGIDECRAADADADGAVGIGDLIRSVASALDGCRVESTPTSTATTLATVTATPTATLPPSWIFSEVGEAAGVRFVHEVAGDVLDVAAQTASGVAAGDYDGDGWIDLYVAGGASRGNPLFRNRGDGTFEEVTVAAELPVEAGHGAAFTLADIDGDRTLDLFSGGVGATAVRIFGGQTNGVFSEETSERNFAAIARDTFSSAWADYDNDGDIDLCLTHWGAPRQDGVSLDYLYRNDGDWAFQPVGVDLGVVGFARGGVAVERDPTLSCAFADLNDDGWQDLVFAADSGNSEVFLNDGGGAFERTTSSVVSDENGKGVALGDYDNDGDVDWFVSGTWDPNGIAEGDWGISGNRLYRNRGDGTFDDATDAAGVRQGFWGWASCFADFDNDGDLDLFQVNGFRGDDTVEFVDDPSRLFLNRGDGSFAERSVDLGFADRGQGRALACFDYDRDGDVDVFIADNGGASQLWRNDGGDGLGHYLGIRLAGRPPNTGAIGARITVSAAGRSQIREIRAGSSFASQDPAEAHFGFGAEIGVVDRVHVRWPRRGETEIEDVNVDQLLVIEQP